MGKNIPQVKSFGNISLVITTDSKNVKTGDMLQTWIIRNDMKPTEACRTGKDRAICGDCPHRNNSCYVNIGQAPQSIFYAMERGSYNDKTVNTADSLIRCGAYGDPAFISLDTWSDILKDSRNNTGYTHQWRDCDSRYSNFLMASCDNESDYYAAKRMGYRTFRVRHENDPLLPGEINCLADTNDSIQCKDCLLCNGNRSAGKPDISIPVHGSRKKNF